MKYPKLGNTVLLTLCLVALITITYFLLNQDDQEVSFDTDEPSTEVAIQEGRPIRNDTQNIPEGTLDIANVKQEKPVKVNPEDASSIQFPQLAKGTIADGAYFAAIREFVKSKLKEEMLENKKLEKEHLDHMTYLNSGYKEYDKSTLEALVENGDVNASLALMEKKDIDKSERLVLLKSVVATGNKIGYLLYALKQAKAGEELNAYLTVANEKGSELAGFNLEINAIANKSNGNTLNQEAFNRYLVVARKDTRKRNYKDVYFLIAKRKSKTKSISATLLSVAKCCSR